MFILFHTCYKNYLQQMQNICQICKFVYYKQQTKLTIKLYNPCAFIAKLFSSVMLHLMGLAASP